MIQNFISKFSVQEKKIFYVAVAMILLAITDRVFLGPVTVKLKNLDEEIDQEKNIIRSDLRLISYKDRILKENKDFNSYYAKGKSSEEEIIATFLKKIEMIATDSTINLIKVSPSESKQKKGFKEYYAQLECEGRLENVTKFIYSIDTSPDLLKILSLNMNPKKAGSEDVLATMTVTKIIIDSSSAAVEEEEEKKSEKAEEEGAPQEEAAPKQEIKKAAAEPKPEGEEVDPTKPTLWESFMKKGQPKGEE